MAIRTDQFTPRYFRTQPHTHLKIDLIPHPDQRVGGVSVIGDRSGAGDSVEMSLNQVSGLDASLLKGSVTTLVQDFYATNPRR